MHYKSHHSFGSDFSISLFLPDWFVTRIYYKAAQTSSSSISYLSSRLISSPIKDKGFKVNYTKKRLSNKIFA